MADGGANAPFFVDNEVITLTRNGVWIADGYEITHEPTRALFARSLKRDEKGYFLAIGRETKRITVEDTAYFVQRVEGDHRRGFELSLSDGTRETLVPETLAYSPGRLVCLVKDGTEHAKFLSGPYYEVLKEITESDGAYWLSIGGKRIKIADTAVHYHD